MSSKRYVLLRTTPAHLLIFQAASIPEGQNELKRNQLRELAALNGTLRDDENQACQNCGEIGHRKYDCPQQRNYTTSIICRVCGNAGHMARDCPDRARGQDWRNMPPRRPGGDSQDQEFQSLVNELGGNPTGDASRQIGWQGGENARPWEQPSNPGGAPWEQRGQGQAPWQPRGQAGGAPWSGRGQDNNNAGGYAGGYSGGYNNDRSGGSGGAGAPWQSGGEAPWQGNGAGPGAAAWQGNNYGAPPPPPSDNNVPPPPPSSHAPPPPPPPA